MHCEAESDEANGQAGGREKDEHPTAKAIHQHHGRKGSNNLNDAHNDGASVWIDVCSRFIKNVRHVVHDGECTRELIGEDQHQRSSKGENCLSIN